MRTNIQPERPARDVAARFAVVDQGGVVVDARTGRVHRLNASGALVWQLLDGSSTSRELAAEIESELSLPAGSAVVDVANVVQEFWESGLLAGGAGELLPTSPSTDPDTLPAPPAHRGTLLGPYCAATVALSVNVIGTDRLVAEIAGLLGPLAVDTELPIERLTVWEDASGWHVRSPGEHSVSDDERTAVDWLLWHLNWTAARRSQGALLVHAAVVARGGAAIVLPGVANAGKSTLAALLVRAGYDYLTDEIAVVDLARGVVRAYPKPIGLDPGSHRLFPDLAPPDGARHHRWHVLPEQLGGSVCQTARVAGLVVPRHLPGADNVLVPMEPLDAIEAVLSQSFNLRDRVDELDQIVELFGSVPAYSIEHDGADGPVAALEALW